MKTWVLLLLSSAFAIDLRENSKGQSIGFPWRVSISFAGFHFCAGALISDTLVLTAATCLAIFDEGTSLDIELGDGQHATSNEMIVHPDYNSTNLYADLGIIRLPKPFQVDSFWHVSPFSPITIFAVISYQAHMIYPFQYPCTHSPHRSFLWHSSLGF